MLCCRPTTMVALVVCALLLIGSSAPRNDAAGATRQDTVAHDLDVNSRTVLGIILGRSNLAEAQARLGRTRLWSDGDAATAEAKVCYVTQGPDAIVLVYASNLEMAGPPENQITDIRVLRATAYPGRAKCLPLRIAREKVSTRSGLRLGLKRQEVRQILGPPHRSAALAWSYSWSVDLPLPTSDPYYKHWAAKKDECFNGKLPFFSVGSEIDVSFEGEVVTAISLSRMESIC